ncbi:hypothetical protein LguiB_034765 [Lonicera macranthoides]
MLLLVYIATLPHSHKFLSTDSRFIVDAKTGQRVKLYCVNWPAHMNPMIPEGLQKKSMKNITYTISSLGFNCVRLTYATYMYTRHWEMTVEESLDELGLEGAKEGVRMNNPWVLNMTVVEVQKRVVEELGAEGVMVVLDNHVSFPMWCCGYADGNGFFGDRYFDPKEWLKGLSIAATLYKGNPTVVAMSIRNELRGPRQNEDVWYLYVQDGASAIRRENPDVLVIIAGLTFETNLSFLKKRPLRVTLSMSKKMVYEAHWYAFGDPPERWIFETNGFCAAITDWFMSQSGFVLSGDYQVPLFLSEFGKDLSGLNEAENRYFSCMMALVAEKDIDWAFWGLQGSYMLREGQVEMEEVYGLYDYTWQGMRNNTMPDRLNLILQMLHDPNLKDKTYNIMYHLQTGRCLHAKKQNVTAGECQRWSKWSHEGDESPIFLRGGAGCLTVVGEGLPPVISDECNSPRSVWRYVSSSKLHLAAKDNKGMDLCLDWNSTTASLVTNKCLCVGEDLVDIPWCYDDPTRQWFKLIPSNKR